MNKALEALASALQSDPAVSDDTRAAAVTLLAAARESIGADQSLAAAIGG